MNKFNIWLAKKITGTVGTMWTFYAFCILACISLPAALKSHSTIIIVAWVTQTFIQLVLLPAIMVGQKLQSEQHSDTLKAVKQLHKHFNLKEQ